MNTRVLFMILLISVSACDSGEKVEGKKIRVQLVGDINEGDWIEVNNFRIEFKLPDPSTIDIDNQDYNPYNLKIDENNSELGYAAPSTTYTVGPGRPVKLPLSEGIVLMNIARILEMLSYDNYGGRVFHFITSEVVILQGLMEFEMYNNDNIVIQHPKGMNIKFTVVEE